MRSHPAQNFIGACFTAFFLCTQWVNAAESEISPIDPDELIEWDIPRMPLYEAADLFSKRLDVQVAVTTSNAYIGPIKGLLSPRQLFALLAEATCGTLEVRGGRTYLINARKIPRLNDRVFHYQIPRDTFLNVLHELSRQTDGLVVAYLSSSKEEEDTLVGPYNGRWSPLEAIRKILSEKPGLTFRWFSENMISIEPKAQVSPEQDLVARDLAGEICRVTIPPTSDRMLVTAPRWASFADVTSPTIIDRKRIEDSGQDSVPDVLQQLSQNAYHRGLGFRATGTQCAVLRGIAPVKVLLNGRPMLASAADYFEDNCVDLNNVPLSAIEHIEISSEATSLAQGADALGGTINLVLKTTDTQTADARYQSARGGAGELHTSIVAGASGDSWLGSLVLDYFETSSLQGAQRERWRDQDFRRFGGQDYRSSFSAPPNLSLNGTTAAVRVSPTGAIEVVAGEQNQSSLSAWQDIVPDIRRMNVVAIAERDIGIATLRSEFLLADRLVTQRLAPEVIPGLELGEHHYQNPFGAPVFVQAALTGLPLPEQEVDSTLLRGVLQVDGSWSKLDYSIYALHSTEEAAVITRNFVDYGALAESLSGLTASPLNVLTDRPGVGGNFILSPPSTARSVIGGTIFSASVRRDLFSMPGGNASAQVGAESWREFADYGNVTARVDRQIASAFGIVQLPIAKGVKARLGARVDDYEQLDPVTSYQYSLDWKPLRLLRLSASYSDTFAAPRMFDLNFPVQSFPTMIFDPSWGEVVPVTVITGGNENLRPTVGRSSTLRMSYGAEDAFNASVDLWSVAFNDRVGFVLPQSLLAYEDTALGGRVTRDPATAEDVAAGRRGRLRTLDLRRANFGGTETRGIDVAVSNTYTAGLARVTPQLDATYTDDFRYADLPSTRDPGRQRTGVADVLGTITRWRLRGWVHLAVADWSANVLGRWNSCYEDVDATLATTGRHVCPGLTVDFNVMKKFGEHFKVTVGASDVFDSSPTYSAVNGAAGIDLSQEDLVGRTLFITLSGQL